MPSYVHPLFESAAVLAGSQLYRHLQRRAGEPGLFARNQYAVVLGCLLGAAVGNRVVSWVEAPHLFAAHWADVRIWFAGQSMVGGLLGGLVGVELAKKLAGVTRSTGDAFVFPILLGLIIGRIGCFLSGLDDRTYGVETALPWGVDFGDGVKRHPTQLYEIGAAALAWIALARLKPFLAPEPGLLFKVLLAGYLTWRFVIDFLKPVPFAYVAGLSGIQLVCLFALAGYVPTLSASLSRLERRT